MTEHPLVSVICLCYNHEEYVAEAIHSVYQQTYPNIELIVVDDCSEDNTVIHAVQNITENTVFIRNTMNLGNCKSFNLGLKEAKGSYVIDLAADDVLLPTRIEEGIVAFQNNPDCGVHYCLDEAIDESGESISTQKTSFHPEGDIYEWLIQKYFISAPTMMMKKSVLDELGGYDEHLFYEDFDFWIRSSRNYKYCFTDKVLVQKRRLKNSHGSNQYKYKSKQMRSTYVVCEKIRDLNNKPSESRALKKRIRFELKKSLQSFNYKLAYKYIRLLIS